MTSNNVLSVSSANSSEVKSGTDSYAQITSNTQHASTFYGLAKAAGHDEKDSTEPLGTYTPEAKGAIQQMLGISDLIATEENNLVASKAYAVGDVFTANGKLYKATAAIAADGAIIPAVEGEEVEGANCVETSVGEGFPHDVQVNGTSVVSNGIANVPIGGSGTLGVVKTESNSGLRIDSTTGQISTIYASVSTIKDGITLNQIISPGNQHQATFYGLAKAAGDTTQAASDNAVGTYTSDA